MPTLVLWSSALKVILTASLFQVSSPLLRLVLLPLLTLPSLKIPGLPAIHQPLPPRSGTVIMMVVVFLTLQTTSFVESSIITWKMCTNKSMRKMVAGKLTKLGHNQKAWNVFPWMVKLIIGQAGITQKPPAKRKRPWNSTPPLRNLPAIVLLNRSSNQLMLPLWPTQFLALKSTVIFQKDMMKKRRITVLTKFQLSSFLPAPALSTQAAIIVLALAL